MKNLPLKTVSRIGYLGFSFMLGLIFIILLYSNSKVIDTQNYWLHYQIDRADKPRLESVLRSNLGFGGMIHNYKNYIIRQQDFMFEQNLANLGAAKSVIEQYYAIGTNEAEMIALKDITNVVDQYFINLYIIREMITKGATPEEIDKVVIIDDTIAFRGLNVLRNQVQKFSRSLLLIDEIPETRGQITADIRLAMGYGGMIHQFKNSVLRVDPVSAEQAQQSINNATNAIQRYRSLEITEAETLALEDVELTLEKYQENLIILQNIIRDNPDINIVDLDQQLRVDDTLALRGLTTIDLEVSKHIHQQSKTLNDGLLFLEQVLPRVSTLLMFVLCLTLFAIAWFMQSKIFSPIKVFNQQMKNLLQGNLEKMDDDQNDHTEFGEMVHGLEKMRINLIERNEALEKVETLATTDSLTGLGNRTHFSQKLADVLKYAKRNKTYIALMMIDLDRFKPINDNFGHATGDAVLVEVAKRMQGMLRETDYIARLGGDEFVIIATDIEDKSNILLPAKRINDQLQLPHYIDGEKIIVGGSIGISIYPDHGKDEKTLLHNADTALYMSKNNPRTKITLFGNEEEKGQVLKIVTES